MTTLLDQAVAELQKLPPDEQDRMAALILEELADEARWDHTFAQSADVLSQLAAQARKDRQAGKTRVQGIDEL